MTIYHQDFIENGYDSLDRISRIQNGQQLEYEMGIKSPEHQKIIMDAIHKINHEDIMEEKSDNFNLNKSGRRSSISIESIEQSSTNETFAFWICCDCGKQNKIGTGECRFCVQWTPLRVIKLVISYRSIPREKTMDF